jgi:hypothetical protein
LRIDPDVLMKLIRQHFNEAAAKPLICTRWKDGIDIDQPAYAIEAFAESVAALFAPPMVGEVSDPKFRPTKEDLAALRADAAAMGREPLPVTVNVAPAVLYMGWPNRQHDPSNPDSTPYRCVSFRLNT